MTSADAAFLDACRAIVGAAHVIGEARDMEPFLVEQRGLYHGRARAVVRPATTDEVARLCALCFARNIAIVPQGGNTGLVGGQTPDATGAAIVLSLTRLNRIRDVDTASQTLTVEAGATLATVQAQADAAGMLFPLWLASQGSCTIGGNLATNAGGTNAIVYGTARDLALGLEVVLADGRILNGLSKLKKDNTGYDLSHLFMGSEGTLGIITAAVLKLFPKPRSIATAFVALASPQAALSLLVLARQAAGDDVKTFELMPRIAIDFVLRHSPSARDPLAQVHPWYVLIELASTQADGMEKSLATLLEQAIDSGLVQDAALAESLSQRAALWRLREDISDVQKQEGGSIKHDISVPVASVPAFMRDASDAVMMAVPGARIVAFGHLGDGNIHFNVSQPVETDKQAFLDRWVDINARVHAIVARYSGSISAEHGIGQLKRDLLPAVKDAVALNVMRAIKRTLDPTNILNPGKVLAAD